MSESKTVGAQDQASLIPSKRRISDEFKRSAVRLLSRRSIPFSKTAESAYRAKAAPHAIGRFTVFAAASSNVRIAFRRPRRTALRAAADAGRWAITLPRCRSNL